MSGVLSRLRWQLTLSHLAAIVVTLVTMIGAVALFATIALTLHGGSSNGAVDDAHSVAETIGGVVQSGDANQLAAVIDALATGRLKLSAATGGGPPWTRNGASGVALRDIAFIAVVGEDGSLLTVSGTGSAGATDPVTAAWSSIVASALTGSTSTRALQAQNSGDVRSLGAYPVFDSQGKPLAAVVIGKTTVAQSSKPPSLLIVLAAFGAATVAVLLIASLFALASSAVVAYFLSRRFVGRLEHLGAAARALAAGDLSARVEEGRPDEIGALARQFNRMVAELQRMVVDLAAERDRARAILQNRRQLVVGVSHELRTPIATVQGYLESTLQDAELSEAVRLDLETMDHELARLQRLVEDLFTLSRADIGRLELRSEPVDLGETARRIAELMAPAAWRQRRVEVVAQHCAGTTIARADGDRAEQIVVNLIANAVRHTPPGGLVALVATDEQDAVRLEVRDTGAGIAADELDHIFERFYQGRAGNDAGGVGLGLALVKELAEGMGGSVAVESAPGEGSCFVVRLPRA